MTAFDSDIDVTGKEVKPEVSGPRGRKRLLPCSLLPCSFVLLLLALPLKSLSITVTLDEDTRHTFSVPQSCNSSPSPSTSWRLSGIPKHGDLFKSSDLSESPLNLDATNEEAEFSAISSLEYRPNSDFYGVDLITFGDSTSPACSIEFVVVPVADVPIAADITIDVFNKGMPIYLNPLINDGMDAFQENHPICMEDILYSNRLNTDRGGALFFKDIAKEIGLNVLQQEAGRFKDGTCAHEVMENGYTQPVCEPTYMYSGVSVADLDGDGYDEIIVARLMSSPKVFKNFGDGTFEDVTEKVGLGTTDGPFPDTAGVAVADIDNDGDVDIIFTTYGQDIFSYLFINDGTGHFSEEAAPRGVQNVHLLSKSSGTSITFGELDNDGYLDFSTGEWMPKAARGGDKASEGFKIYRNIGLKRSDCPPTPSSPTSSCEGFFEDMTDSLNLDVHFDEDEKEARNGGDPVGTQVFSAIFTDLDGDNWDDLLVVSDYGNTKMFINDRMGGFLNQAYAPPNHVLGDADLFPYNNTARSKLYGQYTSGVVDAMGSAMGDVNEDGEIDIFLSAISCPNCNSGIAGGGLFFWNTKSGNRLYLKGEGFHLEDKTVEYGVADGGWGWGTVMLDFDNDGDLDIALVNGFDFPGSTEDLLSTDSKLWENVLSCESARPENSCKNSGDTPRMVENGEPLGFSTEKSKGRGLISFDFDYDGDLDLFVVNNEGTAELFENLKGNEMDWLKVNVVERDTGSVSLGALVYVQERAENDPLGASPNARAQSTKWRVRKMGPSSWYLGTGEQRTHFGLGSPSADPVNAVKVYWPKTNNTVVIKNVPRNTQLRVATIEGQNNSTIYEHIETISQCPYHTITEVTQPLSGGSVIIDAMKRQIVYYPTADFNGTFDFIYETNNVAQGNDFLSDSGKVTVNVELHAEGEGNERWDGKFPPLNGYGNNQAEKNIGCPFMNLGRLSGSQYNQDPHALLGPYDTPLTEGIDEDHEDARPSARLVSNTLFKQSNLNKPSKLNLNDLHVHFGQLVVHDSDFSTPFANGDLDDMMGIEVPKGDFIFDENSDGGKHIRFRRSGVADSTGGGFGVNREQFNKVTSFLDLSQVYSPSLIRLMSMRSLRNGKLNVDDETGFLPRNEPLMQVANPLEKELDKQLLSGDNRANVHPALLALHTLFHLEHNRICDELAVILGSSTGDDEIFQHARVRLIAKYQAIVYQEWLPALLGPNLKLKEYAGYDESLRVEIKNEFATAAARFGHSQVNDVQMCVEADGSTCKNGHLLLRDSYFNPGRFQSSGMSQLFKGMFSHPAQEIDTLMVDGLRDFLFGSHAFPLDLASINIQRGRDHGLADFNTVRVSLGLQRYARFEDISSDPEVSGKLKSLYKGKIDNIDLFVGGLAEDHVDQGNLGETFGTIIKLQFELLRDGDRFYYENHVENGLMTSQEIRDVKGQGLCDILRRNAWGPDSGFEASVPLACVNDGEEGLGEEGETFPFLFVESEGASFWGWDADFLPILTSVLGTLLAVLGAGYTLVKAGKVEMKVKVPAIWSERERRSSFKKLQTAA